MEVLYRTRETLMDEDQPFKFSNWSTCTCGHIYAAVAGKKNVNADDGEMVYDEMVQYLPVFQEIADILELQTTEDRNALGAVSDFTALLDGVDMRQVEQRLLVGQVTRQAALVVVNEAIDRLEKAHEQDRIDVLSQVEEVVEQAEEKELILA